MSRIVRTVLDHDERPDPREAEVGLQWVEVSPGRKVLRNVAVGREIRKSDARNIRSITSGCAPEQVAEFNSRFGGMGVKYEAGTGDAIYRDRQSKLRVLKARGLASFND